MDTIQTNRGPLTPKALMDELIYAAYRRNRELAPHIKAETWAKVLPDVPAMERRFQQEINDYVDAGVKRAQLERHEGRPDHDLDTAGRPLKAGT